MEIDFNILLLKWHFRNLNKMALVFENPFEETKYATSARRIVFAV